MKVRNLLIVAMAILSVVALASASAQAAVLGTQISVFNNTTASSLGTATSAGGQLIITGASSGNSLTFTIRLSASSTFGNYSTTHLTDTGELTFVSAAELSGLGFSGPGNPNTNGNTGVVNGTDASSVTAQNIYTLTYTVGTIATNATSDLTISWTGFISTDSLDANPSVASLRLDAGAPAVPEPATLLLLGSGLAGLAGFGRRRR